MRENHLLDNDNNKHFMKMDNHIATVNSLSKLHNFIKTVREYYLIKYNKEIEFNELEKLSFGTPYGGLNYDIRTSSFFISLTNNKIIIVTTGRRTYILRYNINNDNTVTYDGVEHLYNNPELDSNVYAKYNYAYYPRMLSSSIYNNNNKTFFITNQLEKNGSSNVIVNFISCIDNNKETTKHSMLDLNTSFSSKFDVNDNYVYLYFYKDGNNDNDYMVRYDKETLVKDDSYRLEITDRIYSQSFAVNNNYLYYMNQIKQLIKTNLTTHETVTISNDYEYTSMSGSVVTPYSINPSGAGYNLTKVRGSFQLFADETNVYLGNSLHTHDTWFNYYGVDTDFPPLKLDLDGNVVGYYKGLSSLYLYGLYDRTYASTELDCLEGGNSTTNVYRKSYRDVADYRYYSSNLVITNNSPDLFTVEPDSGTYIHDIKVTDLDSPNAPGVTRNDSYTVLTYDNYIDKQAAFPLTVDVRFVEVNDKPIVTDIPDIVTDEDTPVTVTILVTDEESNDEDIDLSVISYNSSLLTYSLNGSELTLHPVPNKSGDTIVTIRAKDTSYAYTDSSFNVSIRAVNDKPNVNDMYESVNEDTTLISALVGTDIENSTLTYTVTSSTVNGVLDVSDSGSYTYTPNNDYFGSDEFSFTATDGELISDIATVYITVNSVNDAPTIDIDIADQSHPQGSTFTITDILHSDIDSTDLELRASGTNVVDYVDNGDNSISITLDNKVGNSDLTISVFDDGGLSDFQTVLLQIERDWSLSAPTMTDISYIEMENIVHSYNVYLAGKRDIDMLIDDETNISQINNRVPRYSFIATDFIRDNVPVLNFNKINNTNTVNLHEKIITDAIVTIDIQDKITRYVTKHTFTPEQESAFDVSKYNNINCTEVVINGHKLYVINNIEYVLSDGTIIVYENQDLTTSVPTSDNFGIVYKKNDKLYFNRHM